VEFFLLQDLVDADCSAVSFFSPFDGFASRPVPSSAAAYAGIENSRSASSRHAIGGSRSL
jgi:hypothetical protein